MQSILLALAALACPVGMGLMMWLMMRGHGHGQGAAPAAGATSQQVDELRAEIDQLKAELRDELRALRAHHRFAVHPAPGYRAMSTTHEWRLTNAEMQARR